MRAVTCTAFAEPEALSVQTVPDPTPGPGEVVLRVEAAGVNYPDALMVMGQYQVKPPLPFTPGAEAAGCRPARRNRARGVSTDRLGTSRNR